MTTPEFVPFPKMARLSRECIITEKIDGTNAQICIDEDGTIRAGSRTRWITPESDNFGFAAWVRDNADELRGLGVGRHFGEWWGNGIQRGYGLNERRFSLFNALRWVEHDCDPEPIATGDPRIAKMQERAPICCRVVPVLYKGNMDTDKANAILEHMRIYGSKAAPRFMKPEGIIVFHVAGNVGFKKTLEGDCAKGTP